MLDFDSLLKEVRGEQVEMDAPETDNEFAGVHPQIARGINLAKQWAAANGIPLEVTETVRPADSMPDGGSPTSKHYNGGAADLAWAGLQWGDANFNGIADYLESNGYKVIRDAHGTGPHVHFENDESFQDTTPVDVAAANPEINERDAFAYLLSEVRPEQPQEQPQPVSPVAQNTTESSLWDNIVNTGLNAISSVAEANAEKDKFIKKNNPEDSDPYWMKAARFINDFATTPGSIGLDVINQFARPEAAVGTLMQYAWDKSQGKQTQDKSAVDAAWRGFISNDSDTTRMFKDMGMSDTQAFWANIGRQVIDDPLIIIKPATLVSKAQKVAKTFGITDKVMPTVVKLAKSETGQRIEKVRDFIMGNRPTEELLALKNAAVSGDVYEGERFAKGFKNVQKGMNPEQREILNLAQQASNDVSPIKPIPSSEAVDIVDMYKNPAKNPYGTIPDAIVQGAIKKEDAISAFLQQGEEVPRFLLDDRQWYLYQKALTENAGVNATILVPDAIARGEYLKQLEKAGVSSDTVTQADTLIDAWQKFNQSRFSDPLSKKGIISDETFTRYLDGTHLKRANEAYSNPEKFLASVIKHGTVEERLAAIERYKSMKNQNGATNKIKLSDFIERQNLSPETLKKIGLITDAEYNTMNTVKGSSNALRNAEYLENVAKKFGKTKADIEALETATPGAAKGYTKLDNKTYGALNGMYVPDAVKADVDNVVGLSSSIVPQAWRKTVGVFKVEKLVDIPPIFRNFYSGIPMANTFGDVPLVGKGGSPLFNSMVNTVGEVIKNSRGATNTLVDKAKKAGVLGSSWTAKEAEALLNFEGQFSKAGIADKIKILADKGMKAFGAPDEFWRLVVFDHHLKQGKSVEEAAKIAKRALLDYEKSPVWVNFMSSSGIMPFARFPWLAGVETARALYNKPASVTKWTKPFKGNEAEDRNKVLSAYLRGNELMPMGTSTRIVDGKNVPVQEHLDMNNILPFFNEFWLGNPLTELAQIYRTGKSANGMTIIKDGMSAEDKTRAYAKYFKDSFGPSITSSYGWPSKLAGAVNQEVDYKGRMYNPKDVAMQTLGLRNVPVNYANEVEKRELEMKYQIKNIKANMRRVDSDKTLTKEQKKQSLAQYTRDIQEIDRQYKEMRKAYKRFK